MSRKVKKSRGIKPGSSGLRDRLAGLWPLLPSACVVAVVVFTISGLEMLKAHVYNAPEYKRPLNVQIEYYRGAEWVETEKLIPWIASVVQLPADQSLMDHDLLKEAARQMMESGWVRRVDRVTRDSDGTIKMLCDYRRPIALVAVQGREEVKYIPIDCEGFRLPGELSLADAEKSFYMLVHGVKSATPPVGQQFGKTPPKDNDAVAAVRMAALLFDRNETACGIKVIDVSNFNGRSNNHRTHVKLLTRNGHEVWWGSAPGKEIEEPIATEKLTNVVMLARQGFPHACADVSVYRNGSLVRARP